MKRLIILLIFSVLTINAFGQHWYSQDNQFIYTQKWFGRLMPQHVAGFRTAIAQRWHPVNNVWINTLRHQNQYVGTNIVPQTTVIDVWNETTNIWKSNSIVNYNFLNNVFQNQVIQTANAAGVYTAANKESHQYGANNQLKQVLTEGWSTTSSTWLNAYRDTNVYRNNKIALIYKDLWSAPFFTFYQDNRDSLIYDINGQLAVNYQQAWTGDRFGTAQRNVYTYNDATGKLIELRREFVKDITVNSYDTIFRWTYTYNAQGNLAVLLRQQWSIGGKIWQNHSRVTNTYNANGKLIQELVEVPSSGLWVNSTRTLYDEATKIQDALPNDAVILFPNPTWGNSQLMWDSLNVKVIDVQVFNAVGQLLETIKNPTNIGTMSLNAQNLTQGIYVLKIETSKGVLIKKWLKLR